MWFDAGDQDFTESRIGNGIGHAFGGERTIVFVVKMKENAHGSGQRFDFRPFRGIDGDRRLVGLNADVFRGINLEIAEFHFDLVSRLYAVDADERFHLPDMVFLVAEIECGIETEEIAFKFRAGNFKAGSPAGPDLSVFPECDNQVDIDAFSADDTGAETEFVLCMAWRIDCPYNLDGTVCLVVCRRNQGQIEFLRRERFHDRIRFFTQRCRDCEPVGFLFCSAKEEGSDQCRQQKKSSFHICVIPVLFLRGILWLL